MWMEYAAEFTKTNIMAQAWISIQSAFVLSHMRILPVRVWDIPYAYTRTGYLYAYGMPICVWDDIFTEALSY